MQPMAGWLRATKKEPYTGRLQINSAGRVGNNAPHSIEIGTPDPNAVPKFQAVAYYRHSAQDRHYVFDHIIGRRTRFRCSGTRFATGIRKSHARAERTPPAAIQVELPGLLAADVGRLVLSAHQQAEGTSEAPFVPDTVFPPFVTPRSSLPETTL
jgi:hypothetical protein